MEIILLTTLTMLFAWITYTKWPWAVGVIIVVLPTYQWRGEFLSIPITFLEVLLVMFVVIRLVLLMKQGSKPTCSLVCVLAMLALIIATSTLLYTPDLEAALGQWKAYFVESILFFLILVWSAKQMVPEKQRKLIEIIILSLGLLSLYLSIWAILQYFGFISSLEPWINEEPKRVVSLLEYPNALALLITPIISIYLALLLRSNKLPDYQITRLPKVTLQAGIAFIILTGLLALFASYSEGAFLGIAAALIFLISSILWQRSKKVFWAWFASVVVAAGLIAGFIVSNLDQLRAENTSFDIRVVMWQGSWRLIEDNFILGGGLASFPELYPDHKDDAHVEVLNYPHNFILNFWSETGLLGLAAFLVLVGWFLKKSHDFGCKNFDTYEGIILLAFSTGFITILAQGLFDVPYFKNDLAVLWWLMFVPLTVFTSTNKSV